VGVLTATFFRFVLLVALGQYSAAAERYFKRMFFLRLVKKLIEKNLNYRHETLLKETEWLCPVAAIGHT
jgi:hypothetical protein